MSAAPRFSVVVPVWNGAAYVADAIESVRGQASEDWELVVVDDGSGIPEELLGRVFEPHFSTRSAGTGLGLAIVHRLVTGWGATVGVNSREGEGTTVSIHFAAAGAPGAPGGGPRADIPTTS